MSSCLLGSTRGDEAKRSVDELERCVTLGDEERIASVLIERERWCDASWWGETSSEGVLWLWAESSSLVTPVKFPCSDEEGGLLGDRLAGRLGKGLEEDRGNLVVNRRGLFGLRDLLLLPENVLLLLHVGGEEGGVNGTLGVGEASVARLNIEGDCLVMEERTSDFSFGFLWYCSRTWTVFSLSLGLRNTGKSSSCSVCVCVCVWCVVCVCVCGVCVCVCVVCVCVCGVCVCVVCGWVMHVH